MSDSTAKEEDRMLAAARAFSPENGARSVQSVVVMAVFEGDTDDEHRCATGYRIAGGVSEVINFAGNFVDKANRALREEQAPISMSLTLHSHDTGDKQTIVDGPKDALLTDAEDN